MMRRADPGPMRSARSGELCGWVVTGPRLAALDDTSLELWLVRLLLAKRLPLARRSEAIWPLRTLRPESARAPACGRPS